MGWLKYLVDWGKDFLLNRYLKDFHGEEEGVMYLYAERCMPPDLEQEERDRRSAEIRRLDRDYHHGWMDINTFVEKAKAIIKRPAEYPVDERALQSC